MHDCDTNRTDTFQIKTYLSYVSRFKKPVQRSELSDPAGVLQKWKVDSVLGVMVDVEGYRRVQAASCANVSAGIEDPRYELEIIFQGHQRMEKEPVKVPGHAQIASRTCRLSDRMSEPIVYKGRKYYKSAQGYYVTRRLLHRDVWEDNFGPIPDGYEIHHKDEDKANSSLDNLACISKLQHTRIHGVLKNWMESQGGRQRIAERNRKNWGNAPEQSMACLQCGKEFIYKQLADVEVKFCSDDCRNKHHYANDLTTFVCDYCGKEFIANRYTRKLDRIFCSQECMGKDRERPKTHTCQNCGKEFVLHRVDGGKFCSPECCYASRRGKPRTGEPRTMECEQCGKTFSFISNGRPRRFCLNSCHDKWHFEQNRVILTCVQCGKDFDAYKYEGRKFCSQDCARKARSDEYAEKYAVTITCGFCGKEFTARKYEKRKYCSHECADTANRKKHT